MNSIPRRVDWYVTAATFCAVVLGLIGLSFEPDYGHEPCAPSLCLAPSSGGPGTEVAVHWATWKVVWNAEQSNAPVGYPHSPDKPTIVLFESPTREATDRLTFHVPDVPPGTYAVVFYEVDENYQHYRWDRFTVLGGLPRPVATAVWIGAVAFSLGFLAVLTRRIRSRPRKPGFA